MKKLYNVIIILCLACFIPVIWPIGFITRLFVRVFILGWEEGTKFLTNIDI